MSDNTKPNIYLPSFYTENILCVIIYCLFFATLLDMAGLFRETGNVRYFSLLILCILLTGSAVMLNLYLYKLMSIAQLLSASAFTLLFKPSTATITLFGRKLPYFLILSILLFTLAVISYIFVKKYKKSKDYWLTETKELERYFFDYYDLAIIPWDDTLTDAENARNKLEYVKAFIAANKEKVSKTEGAIADFKKANGRLPKPEELKDIMKNMEEPAQKEEPPVSTEDSSMPGKNTSS